MGSSLSRNKGSEEQDCNESSPRTSYRQPNQLWLIIYKMRRTIERNRNYSEMGSWLNKRSEERASYWRPNQLWLAYYKMRRTIERDRRAVLNEAKFEETYRFPRSTIQPNPRNTTTGIGARKVVAFKKQTINVKFDETYRFPKSTIQPKSRNTTTCIGARKVVAFEKQTINIKFDKTCRSPRCTIQPNPRNTTNGTGARKVVDFGRQAIKVQCERLTKGFKLVQLNKCQLEYSDIENRFKKTTKKKKLRICNIELIDNPALTAMYDLKKISLQENVLELNLFHGTKHKYVNSIMEWNLDYRRCNTSKFGRGVSFSPLAYYSHHYCDKGSHEKVMFLCKVLVQKSHVGKRNMELPYDGFDTNVNNKSEVFVKYHDDTFLPVYKITYNYIHLSYLPESQEFVPMV